MFPKTYFPMNYFQPSYFTQSGVDSSGGDDVSGLRDCDVFATIARKLTLSGAFSIVQLELPGERTTLTSNQYPFARLTPIEWIEVEDASSGTVVRHVTYTLTLMVRGENGWTRFAWLDQLSALTHNALDGSDVGSLGLPATNQLRQGRFDPRANPPEGRIVLAGSFSYPI